MDSGQNSSAVTTVRGPNDFVFGTILGEGSFSTVSCAYIGYT